MSQESSSDQHQQLEQAIAVQEGLRGTVEDGIIDATIAALRKQLADLEARQGSKEQRKQATILFADISGSTAMAEGMDPEDVKRLMDVLWEVLDRVITGHGGYIDKHMGDGVMAIWGAQVAQENDPEQAIRAGLGSIATRNSPMSWRQRPLPLVWVSMRG